MVHEQLVQELTTETLQMSRYAQRQTSLDDPESLAASLSVLSAYLARSGEIYATARLLLAEQGDEAAAAMSEDEKALRITDRKRILSARTRKAEFLCTLAERLNHDLVQVSNNRRKQLQWLMNERALTGN